MESIGNSPEFENKQDISLMRRAIKSRWPIKDSTRAKIVNSLDRMLDSEDDTTVLRAAKQVAELDRLNIEDDKVAILREPKKHFHVVSQMSTQEIEAKIKELKDEMGLPEAAIRGKLAYELEKEQDANSTGNGASGTELGVTEAEEP